MRFEEDIIEEMTMEDGDLLSAVLSRIVVLSGGKVHRGVSDRDHLIVFPVSS